MEFWAAIFAVYLTGGVYYAHHVSRAMWKIARGVRGVPPWIQSELGTLALGSALYLLVWPVALAAYALMRSLCSRRAEEMQQLILLGFEEINAEAQPRMPAHPPPPPPRAIPFEPSELPTHALFFCPNDPSHYPAEDPAKPFYFPGQPFGDFQQSFYAHGPITHTRSIRCACGGWVDVYDSNQVAVRSEHVCASPRHEP